MKIDPPICNKKIDINKIQIKYLFKVPCIFVSDENF